MTGDTIEKVSAEYRKRRIKRIKRVIISICVVLLLLPTVLSIFLMFKVFSLQGQLDQISDHKQQSESGQMDVVQAKSKKTTEPVVTAIPSTSSAVTVQKKVYLTFDDGPGTQTEQILKVLKKNKVKATFFVTGKKDAYSKRIYKKIVKEGHTLGMHSYSHIYEQIYESTDAFSKDFDKLYQYLHKITGVYPQFYRFPGGSSTEQTKLPIQTFIDVLNQKNITYIDWNVISPDFNNPSISKKDMTTQIIADVSKYDSSIVLLYDVADRPMTVVSLNDIIKKLKKENYELLPIDASTVPIQHNQ